MPLVGEDNYPGTGSGPLCPNAGRAGEQKQNRFHRMSYSEMIAIWMNHLFRYDDYETYRETCSYDAVHAGGRPCASRAGPACGRGNRAHRA